MICGVDEAGRGPVIGPLVIAGVLVDEAGIEKLKTLGVKDSKAHTPSQRESLYGKIKSFATCHTIKISPQDLDTLMANKTLNKIEAMYFAEVLETLAPETAYIDAADVSCKNFEFMLKKHMNSKPTLIVEHKADERYPVVSAASIIAKVVRDKEIKSLHKVHGDFGSGYSSDPKTKSFLQRCFKEDRSFPDCVRKRWKTTAKASNLRLEEFY